MFTLQDLLTRLRPRRPRSAAPAKAAPEQLELDGLAIELSRGAYSQSRIQVLPPDGRIRVCVPWFMSDQAIREAIVSRRPWIERHQARFRARNPGGPLRYESGEMVWWLGEAHRLEFEPQARKRGVAAEGSGLLRLFAAPNSTPAQREALLYAWYRERLKEILPPLLARWEESLGLKVQEWGLKRMKTRWGSCNTAEARIWLNLELATRPLVCLEYVLVHELVHLKEASHNARFWALVGQALPDWKERKALLDSGPFPRRGE